MKKKLNLNKESLSKLDDKQMSELRGGLAFLSLWGSNCYCTDPLRHKCCRPDTPTDPMCAEPWSAHLPCDPVEAWGNVREAADGTLQYLDDAGHVIQNTEFDPGDSPYVLVP